MDRLLPVMSESRRLAGHTCALRLMTSHDVERKAGEVSTKEVEAPPVVVVAAAVGGLHGHSLHVVLQSRHPCITTIVHFQD